MIQNLKRILWPVIAACMLLVVSCRDDEAGMHSPEMKLQFSHDTVIFDTVFTSVGSATMHFKVYNPHVRDVQIGRIETGMGEQSHYRINVDGMPGPIDQYTLSRGDSMYIFVDVKIDPSDEDLPFIVRDSVRFYTENTEQHVKLMAWGQDARFYRNEVVCDEIWTADRPYVIIDSILVPQGCRLDIEAGARIHSHHRSSILIGGTLEVDGTPDNRVVFEADRLEEPFRERPGLWGSIHFLLGSSDNIIRNADIKNALIGIRVDSLPPGNDPGLILESVNIQNMSTYGIVGLTAHIRATNTRISHCGEHLVAGDLGGRYEFYHCTFSNSGNNRPSVLMTNADNQNVVNDLTFTLVNSILWGAQNDELAIDDSRGSGNIELQILHNLIRTELEELDEESLGNILNSPPLFKDPADYDYSLEVESPAIGAGLDLRSTIFPAVTHDINGKVRNQSSPDMGAHESQ